MLYTRKGDNGYSGLFNNQERFLKSSEIFNALGDLDELESFLGIIFVKMNNEKIVDLKIYSNYIKNIQNDLFIIQAGIAGTSKKIKEEKINWLEETIDKIEKEMVPLKSFVIPGGTELSATVDVARAITRRAERSVVALEENKSFLIDERSKIYLNRLSSLLFALARLLNQKFGIKEESPDYR